MKLEDRYYGVNIRSYIESKDEGAKKNIAGFYFIVHMP